jgi:hypothetical protein
MAEGFDQKGIQNFASTYWIASPIFFTFKVTLVYGRLSKVICYM